MPEVPENTPPSSKASRGRPRDWHDKTEQNTVKSLDRAMAILDDLSQHQGRGLSEIADGLGQSAATVYRVLVTLEARSIVEFDPVEQLWWIGPQAFVIGARFLRRTAMLDRARPILRALMMETGETANLGVARGAEVLFVAQIETHESIRAFFPPGTLSPLHASGIGKVLLSQMQDEEIARLMAAHPPERFTINTRTDFDLLAEDLAQIRERGYAIDNEEKTLGMRCIAAPVFDAFGQAVAGISVSGPTPRIDVARLSQIGSAVQRAAADLTKALGGEARA
ncbi:MAG: HTH-type transcriptional regulator BhcR [Pseudomonadota bacterium]